MLCLLIIFFFPFLKVFVDKGTPIHDKESMRIVFRSRHSLQLACRNNLTHQNTGTTLNALTAEVLEGHLLLVQLNGIAVDTADGAGTDDIVVEALFLEVSIERNEKQQ